MLENKDVTTFATLACPSVVISTLLLFKSCMTPSSSKAQAFHAMSDCRNCRLASLRQLILQILQVLDECRVVCISSMYEFTCKSEDKQRFIAKP